MLVAFQICLSSLNALTKKIKARTDKGIIYFGNLRKILYSCTMSIAIKGRVLLSSLPSHMCADDDKAMKQDDEGIKHHSFNFSEMFNASSLRFFTWCFTLHQQYFCKE
jgi:hypothetical protein